MSRYYLIRRLRGPAILLLIGVLALLHQLGIIDHCWHYFWPLLITLGVLMLAERAILATEDEIPPPPYAGAPYPGAPYPGSPYPGSPYPGPYPGAPYQGAVDPTQGQPAQPGSAIVPTSTRELTKDPEGGNR